MWECLRSLYLRAHIFVYLIFTSSLPVSSTESDLRTLTTTKITKLWAALPPTKINIVARNGGDGKEAIGCGIGWREERGYG